MKLSVGERLFAEGAALTTRIAPVRRMLAGPKGDRVTWLDFYVARSTIEDVSLTRFEGMPHGRKQRALWPVGILAVDGTLLHQTLVQYPGSRLAYAWNAKGLGRAVLFGIVPEDQMPSLQSPFVAGVGIGAEDLNAGLVAARLDRSLVSVGDVQTPAAAGLEDMQLYYDSPADAPDSVRFY